MFYILEPQILLGFNTLKPTQAISKNATTAAAAYQAAHSSSLAHCRYPPLCLFMTLFKLLPVVISREPRAAPCLNEPRRDSFRYTA